MTVLEGIDLRKQFQSGDRTIEALEGVDVSIRPGEFISVMGPSGSGKSTLLNVLGLLDEPTDGTVMIRDRDVTHVDNDTRTDLRKQTVGFVFQSFHLISMLTAKENVMVPGMLEKDPDLDAKALGLLDRVELGDRADHYPSELSGGQKQRVAIARSLVNDPDVLLADEPTGSLDRETSRRVLEEFSRIQEDGVAVVAVTHDDLLTEYVDRVIELVDGRIKTDD